MNLLKSVEGLAGKFNDILFSPTKSKTEFKNLVCYFGGDIQDYEENMVINNRKYCEWSLERTCGLLAKKFPSSDIFVVKCSRMHQNTYACYQNFVQVNDLGSPKHSFVVDSLVHLDNLIANAKKNLALNNAAEEKLILIGFSKGCVVLNQFLYAMNSQDSAIQHRIVDMYWLDGGHCGGANTWITDKKILASFARKDVKVHVHVTPYQVKDASRAWIGKEEKIFTETLTKLGVRIERVLHFNQMQPSLERHFEVLNEFAADKT